MCINYANWVKSVELFQPIGCWLDCVGRSCGVNGLLQRFLYRDRLRADGAGCVKCRHTHQHYALQGRIGGVCRTIPRTGERRLVHLPQHCHSMAGDAADIGRHQCRDHGRPSSSCVVTLQSKEQLLHTFFKHFPTVFLCARSK